MPWRDWSSDGHRHRIWKEADQGSVMLNVYEPSALAGSQPSATAATTAQLEHVLQSLLFVSED